ncbi:MAG: hypothetical protein MRZ63_01065 [Anaerostipes sp.]|uniref:hypothetical protein n=1 Tax=Anaerostipes sp. 992a TaxID=1261637 RepID=UPI0013017146|nr:hypothetical protein [Anaerostipes sp. 992a]MCI5950888.1 hypothetical protein [Anaerostipes sp.]MDD5968460.1 hypothetical protein [Anaerostipes sp.]
MKFQRDIYKNLASLEKEIDSNSEEVSNLDFFHGDVLEHRLREACATIKFTKNQ